MVVKFLEKEDFIDVINIEDLKISLERLEFEADGKTSKITEPDLRYYWDGERFGMHVSDCDFSNFDWFKLLQNNQELVSKLEVLYIGRTDIETFTPLAYNFSGLKFLYLSENNILSHIELKDLSVLEIFEASQCSSLKTVDLNGRFDKLKWVDLSYSNLNTFSLQNADFPDLHNINMTQNTFRNKGDFTFHTAPNLHYVYGLGELPGIDKGFFEGNDLNVRRLNASELIKEIETEINLRPYPSIQLENCYKLNQDDFIYFLDLGHINLEIIPQAILGIKSLEHLCLGAYFPDKFNSFGFIIWKKSVYHERTGTNFNKLKSAELGKLKSLPNLKSLYLNSIDLNSMGFVKDLPRLQSLDVSGNSRLKDFKELEALKELKLFHASSIVGFNDNQSQYLPLNLISISLESCRITNLSFLERFKDLKFAHLGCNQISTESLLSFLYTANGRQQKSRIAEVKYTYNGEPGIYINENPIEEGLFGYLDLKDLKEKEKLLRTYYRQQKIDNEEIRFKQVKLILLGNSGAGKTTFFDILNCFEEGYILKSVEGVSTHGVNISTIEYLNNQNEIEFVLKIYDFGGQDYYHSTHWPYFSQNDTQYVLIFRSDLNDKYAENDLGEILFPLDYWLDSIRKFCFKNEKHKKSSVKVDLLQNIYSPWTQDLNLKDLKIKYGNGLRLNVSPSFDFKSTRDAKPRLRDKFKNGFRKELENNIKSETAVLKARYEFLKKLKASPKGIIHRNKIRSNGKLQSWIDISLDFAFNTNDIIYAKEGKLKDFVITDIGIFNSYIFKILKNEEDGYFNKTKAIERLQGTDLNENEVQFVLDFMLFHKIIFKVEPDYYLAPAFLDHKLSVSENILVETFTKPLLEYRFNSYFHSNIFTEVVIAFSENNSLLPDGLKFVLKKGFVFLYEDKDENRNIVKSKDSVSNGHKTFNKNLIHIVFELKDKPTIKVFNHSIFGVSQKIIEKIHKKLDNLIGYDLEEINGGIEKIVFNKYRKGLSFKALKKQVNSENGKETDLIFDNNEVFRKGDYKLFLDEDERKNLKMKKIFISYSKFDEKFKDEFISHLATLKRQSLVETFDDRNIEMGDKFDPVINQKIEDCDYFICLVSVNFLNVDYIIDKEIPLALKNKKRVIPIIIKPCDWYSMPFETDLAEEVKFGDLNAQNKAAIITLRPEYKKRDNEGNLSIKEFTDTERDMIWFNVVNDIRKLIESDNYGTNPTNSFTSPDEHASGHHQTNGGE